MKNSLLIFISLISVLTACEKNEHTKQTTCVQTGNYDYLDEYQMGSMCTSDVCMEYLAIWRELIMEKNNLSQDFFDTNIELFESEAHTWVEGVSFRVCYKFKIDWAIAYNCDQFIIKINADNTLFPSLDLPRGTYLTKEKIKIAIDNRAFSSNITKMTNKNDLNFISMESALNDLIEYSGVNILCMNRVDLDDDTGNLTLEASAQYESEGNSCIQGTVDLILGDKSVNDTPCWIN